MRKEIEKLSALTPNSVWVFTKQETAFEESFKSALLFSEIPTKDETNVEDYFIENHARYGIKTNRHRILVMPQLFGLITKTPFYEKRNVYNQEKTTAIFDRIKRLAPNSAEYNIVKTEQMLKLKIHAIIDTANNNGDYEILPVLFIYKVLRTLKDNYGITKISLDQLYTYVMTCKRYDEADEAVEFIRNNAPINNDLIETFKSRSRVLVCIKKNIKLFLIDANRISINPAFDEYFYQNFFLKCDFESLHKQLHRNVDYMFFLYNIQGFNINLIDPPSAIQERRIETGSRENMLEEDETDESAYLEQVDEINETNINEAAADGASKVEPVAVFVGHGRRFKTNPLLGKIAIKKAKYSCERNVAHETFVSKKTHQNYMEAHHLIPVCFQKEVWDKYHINIDCVENLLSLCPTCHKAIHYGTKETQKALIKTLYERCKQKYQDIGLDITLEEIYSFYKL